MEIVIIIVLAILLVIVFIGMKHNKLIKEGEKLHKEHKIIGSDGQIREWPIGSYCEKYDEFKWRNLYASRHSNQYIMELARQGHKVLLEDGDDDEVVFSKRIGAFPDEERLGEKIGLYLKDGNLRHLYEGKLKEIKEKGCEYVLW